MRRAAAAQPVKLGRPVGFGLGGAVCVCVCGAAVRSLAAQYAFATARQFAK
jgi:hypothetical protein